MTLKWPRPQDPLVDLTPKKRCVKCRIKAAKGGSALVPSRRNLAVLLTALTLALGACSRIQGDAATRAVASHPVELNGGESHTLNYTPWYIHTFVIEGPPESGIRGGGGNTVPMREVGGPSEGGGMCCTSYPLEWQPDLRLTMRWLVYKDVKTLGAKAPGHWYKAKNVQIAQYDGMQAGGVWAIFLPDDRVRLMITDGNHDGGNNANNRPADDDPLIAQGALDDEWNRLFPNGVAQGIGQ